MKHVNEEDLISLYCDERLSLQQIAGKFNCSKQTVANKLKKLGIKRRSYSESLKGRQNTWAKEHAHKWKGRPAHPNNKGRPKGCEGWSKGLTKKTDERLKNVGKSKEQHWNWKGGISTENILLRQSGEYKTWRAAVFKRDDYTCTHCGTRHTNIEAHHIKSFSEHIEDRFDVGNGITLCKKCHKELHKQEKGHGDTQQKANEIEGCIAHHASRGEERGASGNLQKDNER